jgi:REP element-mobilizing transposase RayT
MNMPYDVGQPFQAAGEGRFPAPRWNEAKQERETGKSSQRADGETGKSPQPADKNVCPTAEPSPLVSGFHSRDHLPHLKREGGTYFVTFRLAGTLPAEVVLKFKQERDQILARALAAKRPLTWQEQEALFRWYANRVDKYLDEGRGDCWLKQPGIADLVAGALRFHEGVRFDLPAWVVMPNHVHVVVRPRPGWTLSKILQSWKGYTAREANRLLGRTGHPFWQTESFDHLVRNDEDLYRCCHYTTANPVNAGLCSRAEDWKWTSLGR